MTDTVVSPRPFRLLATCVLGLGIALFVASWRAYPPPAEYWGQLLLIAAAAILSENFALSLSEYTLSFAYPLTIAAIVIAGPTAGALVAALSAVSWTEIRSQKRLSVLAFNLGQLPLITVLGGWVYYVLGLRMGLTGGGVGVLLGEADFPRILVPLMALALTCALGNILLTGLAISTLHGEKLRTAVSTVGWLAPSQVALAFVGLLLGQVLLISPYALPLFIAPLMIARQLYQRYLFLRGSYSDTVRSLIGALEAKDPYTRGHSERVAEYAMQIADSMGLDASQKERLEYAALLHDVGKLAVPGEILRKNGSLSDAELWEIREHAARGAAMISRIPPLKDLATLVGQHHEWYSGGGYPAGAAGSTIHPFARILAVADSFDAMTTCRSYRSARTVEEAFRELAAFSGSQFDPEVVAAFSRVGQAPDYRLASGFELAPSPIDAVAAKDGA